MVPTARVDSCPLQGTAVQAIQQMLGSDRKAVQVPALELVRDVIRVPGSMQLAQDNRMVQANRLLIQQSGIPAAIAHIIRAELEVGTGPTLYVATTAVETAAVLLTSGIPLPPSISFISLTIGLVYVRCAFCNLLLHVSIESPDNMHALVMSKRVVRADPGDEGETVLAAAAFQAAGLGPLLSELLHLSFLAYEPEVSPITRCTLNYHLISFLPV